MLLIVLNNDEINDFELLKFVILQTLDITELFYKKIISLFIKKQINIKNITVNKVNA